MAFTDKLNVNGGIMVMNKHVKRALALFLSAVMALSVTSCSSSKTSSGSASSTKIDTSKHEVITMLVLGDKPTNGRMEAALKKVNDILNTKVNAELKLQYVSWTDWQTQYNLQLASGDKSLDLIGTATDWLDAWPNAKKGSFLELNESMLKTYCPKTYAQVEEKGDWDKCSYDGNVYFIPEDNYKQYTNHGVFYRGDWAKEAGLSTISNFNDLETYFDGILKNHKGIIPWDVSASGMLYGLLDGYLQSYTSTITINGTTTGNFSLFRYDTSDPYTVVCPYLSGQELNDAAVMFKRWATKGFWREDVLNCSSDTVNLFYAGKTGADEHHTQDYITTIRPTMDKKQPGSDAQMFTFGSQNKNVTKDLATHGAMAVAANSQHPERALMVYDLIRFNKDVYRLINYGIEGKDYVVTSDNKRGQPADIDSTKDNGLGINFWYGRNDDLEIVDENTYSGWKDIYNNLDSYSKDYALEKFVFDSTNVSTQISAISEVCTTYMPQIAWGKNNDPEGTVKKFRAALKSAGIEDVMKEIQTQLTELKETESK
jgi:putative aldouronate transport system substrate-binding protein